MRILCIYRHYWPDITPYARLLKTIVERLAAEGHSVVVFTAQPGYNDVRQAPQPWKEKLNGVDIVRVWLPPERKKWLVLRLIAFMVFLARAVGHAVLNRRRYDLALFNVHPPILMGWAGMTIHAFTGMPYIYHCEDIHPESSFVAGRIRRKWLYKLLRFMDTMVCRRALLNVAPSEDMKAVLLDRGVPAERIEVLNNFSLETHYDGAGSVPQPLADPGPYFNVLFAGNLGDFQGLDSVIEAAKRLSENSEIRFVFMGEGLAKRRLMSQAKEMIDRTVFFIPYQPVEVAAAAMGRASLGLISLAPGVFRVAYPSKTMMYLEAGCPVLAIVEPESCLARSIVSEGLGYSCGSHDPVEIANAVEQAWKDRHAWNEARRDALRSKAEQLFGREAILSRWVKLLASFQVAGYCNVPPVPDDEFAETGIKERVAG